MSDPVSATTHIPEWLRKYHERGFRLLFYSTHQKGPTGKEAVGWTTREYKITDYCEPSNVGTMLGHEIEPGKFLIDIDFDWQDGLPLARHLLPTTGFAFGRGDRKVTHAFYTAAAPLQSKAFKDVDGQTLVELRGATTNGLGHQTMIPPSVHPSGDVVELRVDEGIAHAPTIDRSVTLYAIGCLLLRHLGPRGLLHDVRLAIAGYLLAEGLDENEVVMLASAVAQQTHNDVQDVALAVKSTALRLKSGKAVAGKSALIKAIGEPGLQVLIRIKEWIGGGKFICDGRSDKIIPNNQANIKRALQELKAELRFDLFRQRMIVDYEGYNGSWNDQIRGRIWLEIDERFKFRPSPDFFDVVCQDIGHTNSFHPVRDYLDSLEWDGNARLNEWLITYGGAADTTYVRAVGSLIMIAAVRRVRDLSGAGVKFDELLVLESAQGHFKSSALRALCPKDEWFSDDLPLDVDAKQLIERTAGKWIIEAGELAGLGRSSSRIESLKAMLSRQSDGPVRMAYARLPVEQPRQFIVIGTTNSETYLKDSTGNRRFWPVRVEKFNVDGLRFVRDQLWAEAAHREKKGESIRLDVSLYKLATLQQERRRAEDPWESILEMRFPRDEQHRVTPDEVWDAVGISPDRRDERGQERLLKIMTERLHFRRMTVKAPGGKKNCWGYGRDILEGELSFPEM